jgi:hypothetical protein
LSAASTNLDPKNKEERPPNRGRIPPTDEGRDPPRLHGLKATETGDLGRRRREADAEMRSPGIKDPSGVRRWSELIKDYDIGLNYTPGKANVVADALSWKAYCNNLAIREQQPHLFKELQQFNLQVVEHGFLAALEVKLSLED